MYKMDSAASSFLEVVGKLKHLDRKGWTYFPIPKVETVACHMYRMAMCVFLLPRAMDLFKIMKMALVHDIGESLIGDYTPADAISVERKREIEQQAVTEIAAFLPAEWAREEVLQLWLEFETGQTQEAFLVRDLDKFDMIYQAYEYEKAHEVDLSTFFDSTRDVFKTELVRDWVQHLYSQRRKLHSTSLD